MEPVGVGKIPEDNVQHIRHLNFRQSALMLLNYFKQEITEYNCRKSILNTKVRRD